MQASISCSHLSMCCNGAKLLDDITLSIPRGITALLGESGSGKSALLRAVAGIDPPCSGTLEVFGNSVFTLRKQKRLRTLIGYASESGCFAPNLRVEQNLLYAARLHGIRGKAARARVIDVIQQFSLQPYYAVRARDLSGGFQKRLDLAMAYIHIPQVLLLDEPFAGIDSINRNYVAEQIRLISRASSVVFTWHGPRTVWELADYIVVLIGGVVGAAGTPAELYAKTGCNTPQSVYDAIAAQTLAAYLS